MPAIGHFKSLNSTIRYSLWNHPEQWSVEEFGQFITHDDGLRLVKPLTTGRWTVTKPIGYIQLNWWTSFTINAMVHGDRINRPVATTFRA